MTKLLELNPEEEPIEEVNRHISNFELLWSWLLFINKDWDGRALFATEGGYLRCAPEDVAARDIVYVLYGRRTLYVLREEEDGYRFIDEAYIYKYIDGQIFEMLDQELVIEEAFSIF